MQERTFPRLKGVEIEFQCQAMGIDEPDPVVLGKSTMACTARLAWGMAWPPGHIMGEIMAGAMSGLEQFDTCPLQAPQGAAGRPLRQSDAGRRDVVLPAHGRKLR